MNRITTGFLIFLALTGATSDAAFARADTAAAIREELAAKKAAHAETSKKAKAINAEVSKLKERIMSLSANLRSSEESLSATDRRLRDLRTQKNELAAALYKEHQAMGGLIVGARKYKQVSTLEKLARNHPIDAARAAALMKSMMPEINRQSTVVQEKLDALDRIERGITAEMTLKTTQNKQLNRQQTELASLLKAQSSLLAKTDNQRIAQEKEMDALSRKARNLEDLMRKVENNDTRMAGADKKQTKPTNRTLPSNILLPVHGDVITGFGEEDELGAPSKGLTFDTRAGASVVVPLAGTVKFTGPFQNYKQILIVEHPGGYHSLIAGLGRINTAVGRKLSAGEPVGAADDGKNNKLYYELRQNGKPVNPRNLIVAQKKQGKG